MLNKIEIQGRLTLDPELKTTQSGKSVVSFTIACNRGKNEEGADFIGCVAWERTAEMICQWFRRGQEAIIVGRLGSRKYKDRVGNQRTAWEITVSEIHFCGPKKTAEAECGSGEADDGIPYNYAESGDCAVRAYDQYLNGEDELPF